MIPLLCGPFAPHRAVQEAHLRVVLSEVPPRSHQLRYAPTQSITTDKLRDAALEANALAPSDGRLESK